MIYAVSRRGDSHHDNCEDSNFFLDFPAFIVAGVFDGCSTGINSHMASAMLAASMKKSFERDYELGKLLYEMDVPDSSYVNKSFISAIINGAHIFKSCVASLGLSELETLSTAIVVLYHKKEKRLYVKMLGDGYMYTIIRAPGSSNTRMYDYTKEYPGNAPVYLGYHLDNIMGYVLNETYQVIDNIEEFSICTDGIDSLRPMLPGKSKQEAKEYLLQDESIKNSKAMLSRKLNLLKKEGFAFDDDISVIRYHS